MALSSPENRLWWKEHLHGVEITWILITFLWGLVMFFTMVYWHIAGDQNLSNEAYRVDPEAYGKRVEAFADEYKVREEGNTGTPVVRPPAGGDAYMLARLWDWWPILELQKGQSYRLHLSSMDWMHGWSLQPTNINLEIHPNYEMIITITPTETGTFGVVCNEYCGVGHSQMIGRIYVVD